MRRTQYDRLSQQQLYRLLVKHTSKLSYSVAADTDLQCRVQRRLLTAAKVHCVRLGSRQSRGTRRTFRRRGSARRSAAHRLELRKSTTSTRSTSSTWTRRCIRSPGCRRHCAAETTSESPSHVSLTSPSDDRAATACLQSSTITALFKERNLRWNNREILPVQTL